MLTSHVQLFVDNTVLIHREYHQKAATVFKQKHRLDPDSDWTTKTFLRGACKVGHLRAPKAVVSSHLASGINAEKWLPFNEIAFWHRIFSLGDSLDDPMLTAISATKKDENALKAYIKAELCRKISSNTWVIRERQNVGFSGTRLVDYDTVTTLKNLCRWHWKNR